MYKSGCKGLSNGTCTCNSVFDVITMVSCFFHFLLPPHAPFLSFVLNFYWRGLFYYFSCYILISFTNLSQWCLCLFNLFMSSVPVLSDTSLFLLWYYHFVFSLFVSQHISSKQKDDLTVTFEPFLGFLGLYLGLFWMLLMLCQSWCRHPQLYCYRCKK